MNSWLQTIELIGEKVKLIPLLKEHKKGLLNAAADGNLWNLWYTSVPSIDTIELYIESALGQLENKTSLPFTIVDANSNNIIGCTRYCNVDSANKRLEIGYTWYSKSVQRTGINTESKYLLLKYAFEQLGCIAVEFRTNWHNHPSRNAILRLGAKQDGVLRNHKIDDFGNLRDTVVFSIISQEWNTVKKSLEYEMSKYNA